MADHVMVPVDSCVHCPHMYKCMHSTYGVHDTIPAKCPYKQDQFTMSNNTIQPKAAGGL